MALRRHLQIPDDLPDEAGRLLRQLYAIPAWTAEKHALYAAFERLAKRERYLAFSGDCRDYHLERKGQHCLYDIPFDQRGALRHLAGKRVRLVCGGAFNPYSDRFYFAKKVPGGPADAEPRF